MHRTADFCMRHYAGFSQIGSQFWWGKTLENQSFQSFGEENIGKFTKAKLVTLVIWVKYWQMMFISPNSPKFSLAKILCYTVFALVHSVAIAS